MLRHIALISQSRSVRFSELTQVGAALQKQAARDFGPIWSIEATFDVFAELADVPLGYWPVLIRDDVSARWGAAGIHLDDARQPFALVQADTGWPLAASHEVLEMLADPYGDRLVAGQAPLEANAQGRVEYLVEVCDPSESADWAYTVNGIAASDFYTPAFFDSARVAGLRYSYTGAIAAPRQVLRGGYLSWRNPMDAHWHQLRWFTTPKPIVVDLGVFDGSSMSTREWIDRQTEAAQDAPARRRRRRRVGTRAAADAWRSSQRRALQIEDDVARLLAGA